MAAGPASQHSPTTTTQRSLLCSSSATPRRPLPRARRMLHFAEPPRWAPGVRIILVDVEPSDRDAGVAATLLRGDARAVLGQLGGALVGAGVGVGAWAAWTQQLAAKAGTAVRVCVCVCRVCVCACHVRACVQVYACACGNATKGPCELEARQLGDEQGAEAGSYLTPLFPPPPQTQSLAKRLQAAPASPLEYYGALGALRAALQGMLPAPIVVSEGANTMDMARLLIPTKVGGLLLRAGTVRSGWAMSFSMHCNTMEAPLRCLRTRCCRSSACRAYLEVRTHARTHTHAHTHAHTHTHTHTHAHTHTHTHKHACMHTHTHCHCTLTTGAPHAAGRRDMGHHGGCCSTHVALPFEPSLAFWAHTSLRSARRDGNESHHAL